MHFHTLAFVLARADPTDTYETSIHPLAPQGDISVISQTKQGFEAWIRLVQMLVFGWDISGVNACVYVYDHVYVYAHFRFNGCIGSCFLVL